MKNTNYLMAAAAAAACLCSCKMELDTTTAKQENSNLVELTVSVPQPVDTKAAATSSEKTVNSLQIYVFNADGTSIEAYAKGTTNVLTAKVALGSKLVAALVNAPDFTACKNISTLKAKASTLSENTPSSFVMFGTASTLVTTSAVVAVPVDRLAARVIISKITNALSVEQYKNESITLNKIFLVNVGSTTTLGNGASVNADNYINKRVDDASAPLSDLVSKSFTSQSIAKGSDYSTPTSLYCYPNPATSDSSSSTWSARRTRLVVDVTIDGVEYYYPITIAQTVNSNTSYEIPELIITRLGSTNPDIPIQIGDAQFTVNIKEWSVTDLPTTTI